MKIKAVESIPDVPPMPQRLGDCLPVLKGIKTPSEAQKRRWAQQRDEEDRVYFLKKKLEGFRQSCGGKGSRLDPWEKVTIDTFQFWGTDEEVSSQRLVVDKIRKYIVDLRRHFIEGNGIFLIGNPGTGKDHLAVSVVREYVLRLGLWGRMFFCPKFRVQIRDSYKKAGRKEGEIIEEAIAPHVIILSDPVSIGSKLTDTQAELFVTISEERNKLKKPTIITANFQDEAEAKSVLGAQVVSRLSQGALRLLCNWEDFRTERQKYGQT